MIRPHVFDDAPRMAAAAASLIQEAADRAIAARGRFLLVLAGGTTPRAVYHRLAAEHAHGIDWERVHLFWGDERAVPPEHPDSNFRMVAESLLSRVRVPPANVHRMRGEAADGGASEYDEELQRFFGARWPGGVPGEHTFDLVLLGIGADGHTASLFSGSEALATSGWATTAHAPASSPVEQRITLTLPAINGAREVLFLAAGSAKRDAVASALSGAGSPHAVPAARVRARGSTRWFLDRDAAPEGMGQ
jgi:6-phosphogluconolactonase